MDQFREDVRRIMEGSPPLEAVSLQYPASYGWQRRAELDDQDANAWERPDGMIFGVRRTSSPEISHFDQAGVGVGPSATEQPSVAKAA